MDFLGLKTLNVIKETLNLIQSSEGKKIKLKNIPLEDKVTYKLLSRGETVGVFQVESRGMQDLLKRLEPERFEDIIATLALYRPGPLQSGMVDDFINRKNGRSRVEYLHPKLKPILEETYGVILYQEQVMRIANELAGFTLGEADILRRAMGKKIPKLMDEQREKFIQGAVKRGIDAQVAEKIFELMAHFSGYGFNKSHSTGYALISYQTAFLKANYPLEFMAALLTSEKDNTDKLVFYINECQRMGIKILPPDINQSGANFTVVGGRKIRFGLTAIKNVGESAISSIIKEREEKGKFTSLFDFCQRVDLRVVNKKVLESLVKCGAFDSLPANRSQKLAIIDEAVEEASRLHREQEKGQLSLFGEGQKKEDRFKFPPIREVSRSVRLNWEKELLGVYFSGHPLDGHRRRVRCYSTCLTSELKQMRDGTAVKMAGVVNTVTSKKDKRGKPMAFISLEDLESEVEVVIFATVFEDCASYLKEGEVVALEGRVDASVDPPKIIAQKLYPFSRLETMSNNFHIRVTSSHWEKEKLEKIKNILGEKKGKNPLYFHFQDEDDKSDENNGSEEEVIIKSKSLRVDFSEETIAQIEELLGRGKCWLGDR
jgi:DNA polymerase-3 subunit alpha